MSADIKQEVLQMVQSIDNEDLLQLLKLEIEYFIQSEEITSHLTSDDFQELKALADEPEDKEFVTQEEFTKITARWRM